MNFAFVRGLRRPARVVVLPRKPADNQPRQSKAVKRSTFLSKKYLFTAKNAAGSIHVSSGWLLLSYVCGPTISRVAEAQIPVQNSLVIAFSEFFVGSFTPTQQRDWLCSGSLMTCTTTTKRWPVLSWPAAAESVIAYTARQSSLNSECPLLLCE